MSKDKVANVRMNAAKVLGTIHPIPLTLSPSHPTHYTSISKEAPKASVKVAEDRRCDYVILRF